TSSGLVRFNPTGMPKDKTSPPSSAAEPMFVVYYLDEGKAARFINVLAEDQMGAIWCGTEAGLYRMDEMNGQCRFQRVKIGLPSQVGDDTDVEALLLDRSGALWIGTSNGL